MKTIKRVYLIVGENGITDTTYNRQDARDIKFVGEFIIPIDLTIPTQKAIVQAQTKAQTLFIQSIR